MTSDVRLTKTRKVLDFYVDDEMDTILFHNPEGENGETLYPLSRTDYEGMGRPAQITVTIEPGDLLSEEDPYENGVSDMGVPL